MTSSASLTPYSPAKVSPPLSCLSTDYRSNLCYARRLPLLPLNSALATCRVTTLGREGLPPCFPFPKSCLCLTGVSTCPLSVSPDPFRCRRRRHIARRFLFPALWLRDVSSIPKIRLRLHFSSHKRCGCRPGPLKNPVTQKSAWGLIPLACHELSPGDSGHRTR